MDDENELSDFDFLFHSENESFRKVFGDELVDATQWFLDFSKFYKGIHNKAIRELRPQLDKLMLNHYPDFSTITHPVMRKYKDEINDLSVSGLFFRMYYLLIDYNNNVDLRQKEPRLEEFREFYCNPQPPSLRDDENRAFYTWLSDEEWEKEKQEDNKKMIIFNEWEQKRKTEFYDIIQPALFRYLPGLNEIEKDYWVMYAVYLGDEYEIWKSLCENLEITIDFQMPPESVNWPIEEWRKMVHERYDTYGKESDEKRDTRIFGK